MQEGLLRLLYRQGRCDEALKLFDRAIREHPQNPFAQNATGLANVCLKKYSLAIPRFDMAVQLLPTFAEAYLNRGAAYSAAGQYDLAVENFDWAIEQEPWNSLFLTRRGEANFNILESTRKRWRISTARSNSTRPARLHSMAGDWCSRGKAVTAQEGGTCRLGFPPRWNVTRLSRRRHRTSTV